MTEVGMTEREGRMKKHFVEFFSPGTFVSEVSEKPIDEWDVKKACKMARSIKERHGATPYGFQFVTRSRGPKELDSKEVKRSNMYYLGGKVETLAQVEARNDPKEEILRSNMRCNGYGKIIINNNSWKTTMPLSDGDVILEWKP